MYLHRPSPTTTTSPPPQITGNDTQDLPSGCPPPHLPARSTKALSNFPTSALKASTSSQQSSGRRSFVRKHRTSSSFAFSTSLLGFSSFLRASSFARRVIISFCTLSCEREEESFDEEEEEESLEEEEKGEERWDVMVSLSGRTFERVESFLVSDEEEDREEVRSASLRLCSSRSFLSSLLTRDWILSS